MVIRDLVKKALNRVGLDVVRITNSPKYSLLGMKHLPIRTIVDVGANRGQFAQWITEIFPQAQIYCFEPLAEPYALLRQWAENQRPGKVRIFNVALGEQDGVAEFLHHVNYSPSSSFLRSTSNSMTLYPLTQQQKSVPVTLTTLDKALAEVSSSLLPEILIKVDVQGYEDRIVRGGTMMFQRAKACILEVCLDFLYEDQATLQDIVFLLSSLGYRYAGNMNQLYADDGHVVAIDALFFK